MTPLRLLQQSTYDALMPPRDLTVSEWADRYRVLSSDSASITGRWKTSRAPYQKEIMDAFTQHGIHEIVIMASAQVGKSEMELNMLGRAIDIDPGPMLYVQPKDEMAEDYSKGRIAPMIAACPSLRRKVSEVKSRDSNNTIRMKNFPGGSLFITGANSPSNLASKPVRYIFMDEIDRFPVSAGTEGDPVDLAERRTETFRHNRKIVKCSTPTIKGASKIEKAYLYGTQEEWHTQCPYCREFAYIRFDDIKFETEKFKDEAGDDQWIVHNPRWKCPLCKRETGEFDTKRLPAKWVIKNEKALANGIRSFRLNAFMSPWSSWKDICLHFLKAKDDPEALKVFHNTMLGETWELRDRSGIPEKLLARREHYNAEVPTGVLAITMGLDTQDNRLEYEVVGWGRDEESWGLMRGVIPGRADSPGVWEEVDALLDRRWRTKNGAALRVMAAFIDSGGHFTQDVYKQCAKRNGVKRIWPIKGEGGEGKSYVRPMKRGTVPGGMGFLIGVDGGKEAILYATSIDQPGPRYMHFPVDYRAGYDLDYFRGLISEKMVMHRKMGQNVIVWEKTYERNEPLDCRNYARAAFKTTKWDFDKIEKMLNGETVEKVEARQEVQRKQNRRVISRGIQV